MNEANVANVVKQLMETAPVVVEQYTHWWAVAAWVGLFASLLIMATLVWGAVKLYQAEDRYGDNEIGVCLAVAGAIIAFSVACHQIPTIICPQARAMCQFLNDVIPGE